MQNLPVNCQVHIMPDSHDKNEEDLCSNGSAADAPDTFQADTSQGSLPHSTLPSEQNPAP